MRRFAGASHATFLALLREEIIAHHPDGFEERDEEYLYLARKPD